MCAAIERRESYENLAAFRHRHENINEEMQPARAGQFHGPRAIVVAANQSATWSDPVASSRDTAAFLLFFRSPSRSLVSIRRGYRRCIILSTPEVIRWLRDGYLLR